jgi:FtsH-binding integral membrane protein
MKELLKQRAPFMSKVFANLILQGSIAYTAALQRSPHVARNILMYTLMFLMAVLAMVFATLSIQVRFVLFTIISILFGSILGAARNLDKDTIQETLSDILGVFVAMFALGVISVQFNVDIFPLALLLFVGLIGLMVSRAVVSKEKKGALSKAFVIVFAMYILVDTNVILQRNYSGNFVDASFDYFTDATQMFSGLVPANI